MLFSTGVERTLNLWRYVVNERVSVQGLCSGIEFFNDLGCLINSAGLLRFKFNAWNYFLTVLIGPSQVPAAAELLPKTGFLVTSTR